MARKGFTLIELLVVIGIIALLIAIAIPNFLSARQRAGDSRKKQEMAQLKNALRLYYNDFNKYPAGVAPSNTIIQGCGVNGTDNCDRTVCTTVDFAARGASGCENVYMKLLPADFTSKYKYFQTSSGDDFCLTTLLDNVSDPDTATSHLRCGSSCGTNCSASKYCLCAD